ncbi:uncharacterized protein LOC126379151 [Pectinophora gossypiella]|uniref:uncharacterized protein LOC126379151 n=1 Tax=Pectinophora gossypiella TaxID=13191 RepID=UPI00214EA0F9|nr:uncharacterized protein LOC126379151 [Pectinophora gossypiella]
MSSIHEHLNKIREERIAREKARIEKLRELNLKKYNKNEPPPPPKSVSTISIAKTDTKKTNFGLPKNNFHVNGTSKRPITAPVTYNKKTDVNKTTSTYRQSISMTNTRNEVKTINNVKKNMTNVEAKKSDGKLTTVSEITDNKQTVTHIESKLVENGVNITEIAQTSVTVEHVQESIQIELKSGDAADKHPDKTANGVSYAPKPERKTINFIENNKKIEKKPNDIKNKNAKGDARFNNNKIISYKNEPKSARKSFAPKFEPTKALNPKPTENSRKSIQPKTSQSATKPNPNRQSVFERLYQPKMVAKKQITDSEKLQNDPSFLKKVIKNTGLILSKRHTVFEHTKERSQPPVRRSISAVHFRRISKNELSNCFHKWSSIGDKLDQVHLSDINEDAAVKGDKIVSAVKSERKKVKFHTPTPNFNTPKPEELQARLKNWLQKRGKSLDSYHHLQCFGLHHLQHEIKPLNLEAEPFDFNDNDEDKENQPLESDSDNDSYEENMNVKEDEMAKHKWRRASIVSDSVDFNETQDSMRTPLEMHHVDELLLGALNDLTELLREGFDWEQCARWLRAIRDRFPSAPATAAYWECRAALEERRGDLSASVHCWQEAVAKGTERSVVEANLDQLLGKFMQLKISPNTGKKKLPDPKMVDVKNVFKSTLIRFAVQQANLRHTQEPPKYTVTPVRRSGRLSAHWSAKRTPLQVVSTVRQAGLLGHPLVFVPNDKLSETP